MRKLAIWTTLILLVAAAAVFSLLRFAAASSAAQQFFSPGALSPRHDYLSDRCTACHEPTVGVTVTKCIPCHANAERLLGRQPTAFHASVEECSTCHLEHQSANVRPLTMDHIELAKVGARALERASSGDANYKATLDSLETWLRIESPEHFDDGSAREALNCAGCHDRGDPHSKRFGSDCAQCHALSSWVVPGYQHPTSRTKECVQCHQAPPSHSMGHFSMISQKIAGKEHANVDQCFECHNTTGWNDIIGVGFFKHH